MRVLIKRTLTVTTTVTVTTSWTISWVSVGDTAADATPMEEHDETKLTDSDHDQQLVNDDIGRMQSAYPTNATVGTTGAPKNTKSDHMLVAPADLKGSDVAECAVQSVDNPVARKAGIEFGGPELLSPL